MEECKSTSACSWVYSALPSPDVLLVTGTTPAQLCVDLATSSQLSAEVVAKRATNFGTYFVAFHRCCQGMTSQLSIKKFQNEAHA